MHSPNPPGSAVGPDGLGRPPADEPKTVQYWVHTFHDAASPPRDMVRTARRTNQPRQSKEYIVTFGHEANPLRDPRDRRITRIAGPSALVFFGVTGDLARKKLLPAVYDLMNRGLLPPSFGLVGFGRRPWSDDDFRNYVRESVEANARTPFREDVWNQFQQGMRFVEGAFDAVSYTHLTLPTKA